MTLDELTQLLHSEIPMSQALGVKCDNYKDHQLTISAPLAPNINHKNTAFGGSLYSVAVICGWALINLTLREHGLQGQVVIYHSDIKYQSPVNDDFYAVSHSPGKLTDSNFFQTLSRKGLRSIDLQVDVISQGEVRATFMGKYVVTLTRN